MLDRILVIWVEELIAPIQESAIESDSTFMIN